MLTLYHKILKQMKGTYIFLAEGYEPLEALAPMDVLRRAHIDCKFVSISDDLLPKSTHDATIQADLTWGQFLKEKDEKGIDALIFPGGLPGADNLGGNTALASVLRGHFSNGGLTCAICAAPGRVLARNLGTALEGRKMTVYEGFGAELDAVGAINTAADVQVDGNLITAKGPGLAIDFGLAIMERLCDRRVYDVVKHAMML